LRLHAKDLEVAGLGGYALGAAGDDDSNDRQVRLGCWVAGAVVSFCGSLSGGLVDNNSQWYWLHRWYALQQQQV
jgi:hypothetical protein